MHFKKYFLIYTIVPFLILVSAASYYRFMVLNDYMVSYEGVCDPLTEHCFIGCEDEECSIEYYYTEIRRHAVDIYNLCGNDISDCDAAQSCSLSDRACSITHCDVTVLDASCERVGPQHTI